MSHTDGKRRIGYARVSTDDQHPEAQEIRLRASGCSAVFTDHGVSGTLASRPQWDACQRELCPGDVLVTVKLDRIGRSVKHLAALLEWLRAHEVGLVCLDQPIDTTSAIGKMLYTILSAFAEFERDLISERTRDGLKATSKRGRSGGRKEKLKPYQVGYAKEQIGKRPMAELAREFGVSRATLYRALKRGHR